jgi:MFS family permease
MSSTPTKSKETSFLANTAIASFILAIALALLFLVGLGDAYRNYPNFIVDKLNAQGQVVKNSIETFLNAGLPVEQFSGFTGLTDPLIKSDPDVVLIDVVDVEDNLIFENSKEGFSFSDTNLHAFTRSDLQSETSDFKVNEDEDFYQVVLPLSNKFEQIGQLHVMMPKRVINNRVLRIFLYVAISLLAAIAVFAVFAFFFYKTLSQGGKTRKLMEVAYISVYFLVATAVVIALFQLYSEGITAKTEAVTFSLSSRLEAAVDLGLELDDFEGIEETFDDYIRLNPEISFISLKENEKLMASTPDDSIPDVLLASVNNFFEYEVKLSSSDHPNLELYAVLVKSPKDVLYSRLWRSAKNFVALFVASGFVSIIFLNLLKSFTANPQPGTEEYEDLQLRRIEPYYFIGAFVDGLSLSFLPQYLEQLAIGSGADTGLVSTQFTLYFLGWGVAMIPAAKLINNRGVKPVLLAVSSASVLIAILMAFVNDFYLMYAIRFMAGAVQGILTIGVQSYVLEMASKRKKTQGSAMMVFDYFAGRLSSTAIGALLSVYIGITGVFQIATVISIVLFGYCIRFVPQIRPQAVLVGGGGAQEVSLDGAQIKESLDLEPVDREELTRRSFLQDLVDAIKDFKFLKTLLFIGIPYRAIFTGVTVFALPLLLDQQGFIAEDIGNIMMFYAAGALLASWLVSGLVDRLGNAHVVLFLGMASSGLGLCLVGLMSWPLLLQFQVPFMSAIIVIAGVSVLGFGHGCINAPSLTFVTQNTKIAKKIGQTTAGSLYRMIERFGQVAGPILVSQLLYMQVKDPSVDNLDPITISWIGLASVIFGLVFLIGINNNKSQSKPESIY